MSKLSARLLASTAVILSLSVTNMAVAETAPQPIAAEAIKNASTLLASGQYETALPVLRALAEQGNADAQTKLGILIINIRVRKKEISETVEDGLKWLRIAAEQGNVEAINSLATVFGEGYGVTKNLKEAKSWYQKAIALSDTNSMVGLGDLLRMEENNFTEALTWYRKAANLGDVNAQRNLAAIYNTENEDGRTLNKYGITKNAAEAMKWWRKVADKGSADAQEWVGEIYLHGGAGVKKNVAEAIRWYRKAGVKGKNVHALVTLASFYEEGNPVPKNLDEARKLYQMAVDLGNDPAAVNDVRDDGMSNSAIAKFSLADMDKKK